jgi:putative iron-only hydrogenase system regulator
VERLFRLVETPTWTLRIKMRSDSTEGNGQIRNRYRYSPFMRAFCQKERFMKRIAVIGAVLENPQISQKAFNETVSLYKEIIKGRMGIPFDSENTAVIAITVQGELDDINALTGKLGNIAHVTVKTAVSGAVSHE